VFRDQSKRRRDHFRRGSVLGIIALILAAAWAARGNTVWATPSQSPLRQSIPTRVPTPVPGWLWLGRAPGNPTDYAPSGLADFDEHQDDWQAQRILGSGRIVAPWLWPT